VSSQSTEMIFPPETSQESQHKTLTEMVTKASGGTLDQMTVARVVASVGEIQASKMKIRTENRTIAAHLYEIKSTLIRAFIAAEGDSREVSDRAIRNFYEIGMKLAGLSKNTIYLYVRTHERFMDQMDVHALFAFTDLVEMSSGSISDTVVANVVSMKELNPQLTRKQLRGALAEGKMNATDVTPPPTDIHAITAEYQSELIAQDRKVSDLEQAKTRLQQSLDAANSALDSANNEKDRLISQLHDRKEALTAHEMIVGRLQDEKKALERARDAAPAPRNVEVAPQGYASIADAITAAQRELATHNAQIIAAREEILETESRLATAQRDLQAATEIERAFSDLTALVSKATASVTGMKLAVVAHTGDRSRYQKFFQVLQETTSKLYDEVKNITNVIA